MEDSDHNHRCGNTELTKETKQIEKRIPSRNEQTQEPNRIYLPVLFEQRNQRHDQRENERMETDARKEIEETLQQEMTLQAQRTVLRTNLMKVGHQ